MGWLWLSNACQDRYDDPPRLVELPDGLAEVDDLDDPRWLDAVHDFAASTSGRQPRNRSHRWERRR